jgi:hypothetical protein
MVPVASNDTNAGRIVFVCFSKEKLKRKKEKQKKSCGSDGSLRAQSGRLACYAAHNESAATLTRGLCRRCKVSTCAGVSIFI